MYETPYHEKDLSQYSFLITGGAGFIGSHIVEYLLKFGAKKVRVIDNLITGNYVNVEPFENDDRFEFIEGDICDTGACIHACDGIDYVSHQAALGSVPRSIKDPARTNSINVDGFLNMLLAAKEKNVKRFVYASSSSVYGAEKTMPKVEDRVGDPLSPYAVSKKTNELYAKVFASTFGMQIIGLRYFNVFGPRQDPHGPYAAVIPLFVHKILNGETIFIDGDGDQTRDFTFVENAVQANLRALFVENESATDQVYNVAVGENFSVNYMLDKIEQELGQSTNTENRDARPGDIRDSLADISKARNLLGYDPKFSFLDGLKVTVDYFNRS